MTRLPRWLVALTFVALAPACASAVAPAAPLAFAVDLPGELNRFIRSGPTAAHLVLREGTWPRVLVAFPAGDSGLAVWFESTPEPVHWKVLDALQAVQAPDARGRPLRGIRVDIAAQAPRLLVHQTLLSSVRVLRDYEASGQAPLAVQVGAQQEAARLSWARERLDGAPGFQLSLEALDGTRLSAHTFTAGRDGWIHLRLQALCGAPPLTPLGAAELLKPKRAPAAPPLGEDARERAELAFLSYREKYLAGSWRFDTYFGRDTLIALKLLQPALQPLAIESGLDAVLDRLSADGEVAHEEAIGEYAILLHEAAGRGNSAAPIYDYGMIDEDFLLAPLAAGFLLDDAGAHARAAHWLASRGPSGQTRGDALLRNLRFVVRRAAPFAQSPAPAHLVGLKPGHTAGDWRDSPAGLDGGTYPYDVNVALVPAALAAAARLAASPLLAPYRQGVDTTLASQAEQEHSIWARAAPPLFEVHIDAAHAAQAVRQYARSLGIDPTAPLAALRGAAVRFPALALDAAGHPLPVMHSDEVLRLLYARPPAAALEAALETLLRPFPAGLLTPVGLLVANPAYADLPAHRRFMRTDYHGTVVWGWPQAALAAGLTHQLARGDLPASLLERLRRARERVWRMMRTTSPYRGVELWSWVVRDGHYRISPFHPAGGEAEADAAQLWSTVYLALEPPQALAAPAHGSAQR